MEVLRIQFRRGAVHLPELRLWLDPHQPCERGERAFVSHAHSDHVSDHPEVILTAPTSKLMQSRLPGSRIEHILKFGQPFEIEGAGARAQLVLTAAGHIFGSAMVFLESDHKSLLYTGDFKLRKSLSAEPCEPRKADALIMETTFGRPQYIFPPAEEILLGVIRFCREALNDGQTAVLLGYSLGKSQELLCSLEEAKLPVVLHGAVWKITQIYQQFGHCFPPFEKYKPESARGKVLLCPPNVVNSGMMRNLGRTRSAVLTGWAVDPNCRYRYQCDAAFPLSDHADFSELLQLVRLVEPKKVLTLHGFAADFAETLRRQGYDAHALSETDQLALPLVLENSPAQPARSRVLISGGVPACACGNGTPSEHGSSGQQLFVRFAETCARVALTNSKLMKVREVGEYLGSVDEKVVALPATWFTGRPFPAGHNKVLQVGWASLRDAICAVTGCTENEFHQVYLKYSDLGEAAAELLDSRQPGGVLRLEEAGELFDELASARGPLAKVPLLSAALRSCSVLEAKYLVKIITGDLRIGLKEGLVEDAVASAFSQDPEAIRNVHLLVGDIGELAALAAANRLQGAGVQPFRPIKFMLASPEPTAAAIWERVTGAGTQTSEDRKEAWLEDKYDGIRCQLHKVGSRLALYSRDLKEISATFRDLVDAIRPCGQDLILDGEIVAMRGDTILPFSELQRRLGRREGDLFLREEIPIQYVAFDLLWEDGESLIHAPLKLRRSRLEALKPCPPELRLARVEVARSPEEIEAAFSGARQRGNEGLMIKDPQSLYTPGRRGLAWLKLKKAFATLDCVIVGAEYGHGKRSQVLSDYTFAVRDEETGELKPIGKAYSGLTDEEIRTLTEHFLRRATRQRGRYFEVPPEIVLEIAFDKLQASQRHSSGLAMRFPRINRIRADKSVSEIDTLQHARNLSQKSQ